MQTHAMPNSYLGVLMYYGNLNIVTFIFIFSTERFFAKEPFPKLFQDMHGNWRIRANAPGENLLVLIAVQHPELGDCFTATLKTKRVSSLMLSDQDIFFWLMPHKVAVWIYWHVSEIEMLSFYLLHFKRDVLTLRTFIIKSCDGLKTLKS